MSFTYDRGAIKFTVTPRPKLPRCREGHEFDMSCTQAHEGRPERWCAVCTSNHRRVTA